MSKVAFKEETEIFALQPPHTLSFIISPLHLIKYFKKFFKTTIINLCLKQQIIKKF